MATAAPTGPTKPKFLDDYIKARDEVEIWVATQELDFMKATVDAASSYIDPTTKRFNPNVLKDTGKGLEYANKIYDTLDKTAKDHFKSAATGLEASLLTNTRYGLTRKQLIDTVGAMKAQATPMNLHRQLSRALEGPRGILSSNAMGLLKTGKNDIEALLNYTGLAGKVKHDKVADVEKMAGLIDLYDRAGPTLGDKILKDNGYM
jgi:hypothetical protein